MSTNRGLTMRSLIDERQLLTAQIMMGSLINLSVSTIDTDGNVYQEHTDSPSRCPLAAAPVPCTFTCMKEKAVLHKSLTAHPISQICECQWGMKNCISPVIVENVCLGAVVIGHFRVEETAGECRQTHADRLSEIPVVQPGTLKKLLDYGDFLSGYFSEIAAKKIAEQKLQTEMQEKLKYAEESQKAQLKTLSAQINPHFLFNTLNSITRMAFLEDAENTKEMTYCLSDLLRYNLKQTEEFPTIGSEIENIRRYLHIQDIRYNDRIRHHIDIPSQLADFRIPSMLLQPIVENAIVHGLEPKIEGGSIYITGEVCSSGINIVIRDTGVGFKPRRLKDIFSDEARSSMGLGIHNSHQRLQRYFGPDYGLKITSRENEETVVEIRLPCFKELAHRHSN